MTKCEICNCDTKKILNDKEFKICNCNLNKKVPKVKVSKPISPSIFPSVPTLPVFPLVPRGKN
jgi:hypothetical protein